MAYVSKTWVDRDSQYPTRRIIVHPDLTEEQVTVRRDEGIVTTQGDVFDANTMNNLEARIAAGIREKSILAGLDDTDISSPQNGQALIYDATSSKWVNANGGSGSATLAELTDVTLTNPTADQVLKYDGTKWVNGAGGGGGGASDLDDLSDVDITTPTDGQVLKYNGTTQKWENDDESGGGGSYTAGEKIRIDSQDVISADPQYNIIWNGDSLADVKSRHLVGGLPYGFSRTNTASGFDIQHKGFRIDGSYGSDDNKNIIYEPPVSFNDPTWRSGVSDFILELYWTDDPNAEPVIYTKEVLQLEVNGTPETLILNGIELSVILSSGTYGGLFIAVDDTDNANGDIWITGLNLTVKNSTGMLWTPHDLAIQEYVASVAAPLYVEINGTLTAGATTVTLSNSEIRTTSTFDIYTDVYGVNPTAVAVSNGSMTLTFEAQQSAINVKVRIT